MRIEENGIFSRSDKLDPGTEKERANRPKEEYIRDSKSFGAKRTLHTANLAF